VTTTSEPLLHQETLANGLRVLAVPMPHSRSVTVSFYFAAGSRYEDPSEAGISHLVEHLCFKGSRRWPTAPQVSEAIEGVGGVLNAGTDREYTVYYAKVPAAHVELAIDVVGDIVLRPIFDATELEKERNVILEELAMVEDNPGQLAEVVLDALLWPAQALGRDVAGTPESVRAIPRERAIAYRHDQYTPETSLISIAGAVDPDHAVAMAQRITDDWEHGPAGVPENYLAPGPDAPHVRLHAKQSEQAHLMIGLPGLSAVDEDRYTLSLLSTVLGDGMSSRLFVSLREELGLAYDVHAYASNLRDTGSLAVYLGVDPDNALPALRAALNQLGGVRDGVPAAELHRVREYLKGRMLLNMEDTRAVSSWYGGQALLLNRTHSVDEIVERIEAVDPDDLSALADRLIRNDALHLAVVGPFDSDEPFREALHL
jgi:predicted Zn-dependent peptidase